VDSAEQIEELAADWLARREGACWSATDEAQLTAWLQASTAHKVAFLRLEAAWTRANRLKALAARAPPGTVPAARLRVWPATRLGAHPLTEVTGLKSSAQFGCKGVCDRESRRSLQSERHVRAMGLAAGVLLVLTLGVGGYFSKTRGGQTFETQVGAVTAVPLADGSKVTLNTDSQIRIAVTATERRINLGQGEAFFEVAKDPSRPFVVVAGACRVTALATRFSVWREAREVRVTVTEGRVRVERRDGNAPGAGEDVGAGSVAHAGDAGVLVQSKSLREVEEDLSWRRGFLFFHDVPLAQAAAEFNRYNRQRLVIASTDIAGIRIGGNFRSNNVAGFVRLLQEGFGIRAEQRDEAIVLSGN
jgi:transmembrane sensor